MKSTAFFDQWPPRHHAYILSSIHTSGDALKEAMAAKEVSYIYDKNYDAFTINDARMVKDLQSEKTDSACVFILSFSVINHEAQNALLKVLEEPASNTHFFLLYPNVKQLLPTLQSRLEELELTAHEEKEEVALPIGVQEFLGLSLPQRFAWIKERTDAKAGENKLSKEEVKRFLYALEKNFANKPTKSTVETLEVIYEAQRCMNANGASVKMILDMVATHV